MLFGLIVVFTSFSDTHLSRAQQSNRQLKQETAERNPERRIALVIGNGSYQTVKPLKNPASDALLLAATLRTLKFEVTIGTDKSQREMKQLIREFGQRLRTGGGVGLFYFAGHGVQAKGRNYLIPVDADIQTEADLEDVSVDVNYVLSMMDDAQNALNIAILDACRNNPFARSFRSTNDGLAQVKAPTGTLIAYATAPDSVAADGGGANSPYAEELTKQMQTSGVLMETMFRRVAERVSTRSGGRQEPWYSANVKGDFYFSVGPTGSGAPNSVSSSQPVKIDSLAVEREYWETIRISNDAQDYRDYLQAYPTGAYAAIARAKVKQIETAKNAQSNSAGDDGGGQPANSSERPGINSTSTVTMMPPNPPAGLRSFEFLTATLNSSGALKTREKKEALVFAEDPGGINLEMVAIPPGEFVMGSPASETQRRNDEGGQHKVRIGYWFYMGKFEITQAQWRAIMGTNPAVFSGCDDCPVERVSWDDAQEFCRKLSVRTGRQYRLPSEAEWEYAARAGTTTPFAFGDTITAEIVNYHGNYPYLSAPKGDNRQRPIQVGALAVANAFGLYDMHGSVSEWCQDWYHDSYTAISGDAPSDGSAWVDGGQKQSRVFRGGSWLISASYSRSADRQSTLPNDRSNDIGFRVVLVVSPK